MNTQPSLSIAIGASLDTNELPKGASSIPSALNDTFDALAYASLAMAAEYSYAHFLALKYQQSEKEHHRIITPLGISPSHNDALIDTRLASTLNEDEHRSIILGLSSFLAKGADCISLCDDGSYLWSSDDDPNINSLPLKMLDGISFYHFLGAHRDQIDWHPLFTELQMFLHQHPVNSARRAKGLTEVSGVWIWGDGAKIEGNVDGSIFSDDPRHRAWADALGMAFSILDDGGSDWQRIAREYPRIVVMMSRLNPMIDKQLKCLSKKCSSDWHWQNISYRGKRPSWWRRVMR